MSKGRSTLVTGAAGFIGARFVEAAARAAERLVCVDFVRPGRDTFSERPEHRGLAFGERVDVDALEAWLAKNGGDVGAIVHLGACTDTMELDEAVHEKLNVAYSKMLWRFATEARVPMVYASSAATYGDGERGYDDDEKALTSLAPLNPYGWSKHRFDLWALEEERAGRAPPSWAGFKFFNVYGFGERHKGRMASVILHGYDQIRRTGKVRLFKSHREGFGDGEQKRDFVYVEDVVDVLRFALGGVKRGVFNLGTGQARTFADLARATFAAMGRAPDIEYIDMPEELRARYQYFTQARMQRLRATGYAAPFTSLEDGVGRYVARLAKQDEGNVG